MAELSDQTLTSIGEAADILRSSKKAVVLTGAGISTPSGIPDFRSNGYGLWEQFDPDEVASLSAFRHAPPRFFSWMHSLAVQICQARPNAAHLSLAHLEQAGFVQTLITQNIDSLHLKAGSKQLLEVHGSLRSLTCVSCYRTFDAQGFIEPYLESGQIPHCPHCGNFLKPNIMLFGEQLPVKVWLNALEASRTCDLMVVAGSSLEVLPVASLPIRAVDNGARLILINQSKTYLDERADLVFHEDVAEILPRLADLVLGDS